MNTNTKLPKSMIWNLQDQVNSDLPVFPPDFLATSGYWGFEESTVHGELKGAEYWDAKHIFFLLVLAAEGEL